METFNGGIFLLHSPPSPDQPSSCHPGIISLLGLWIANTGYRKTNHRGRAVHLVTPGSLVCDRCNKSARHSPWQATWSSWHHDWSQCLKMETECCNSDSVTHWLSVGAPCEVCCVRLCQGEMWPGMIWNCILIAPAWAPPDWRSRLRLKIKSWRPADLFVFPKLYLLHG